MLSGWRFVSLRPAGLPGPWRSVGAREFRRAYSSKSSSPGGADEAADRDAGPGDTESKGPSVVDSAPVYSAEEAAAIQASDKGSRKSRTGARSEMIQERDPVVVHEPAYPVQNGKWYRIDPDSLIFRAVGRSHVARVPRLGHGLERVLFSPGVHILQDPNSGVYNFDPYIRNITQPVDFDFDKLTPYITSSKDATLMGHARARKKPFVGSTSSMTHVLSHLYFAISAGKQPDVSSLSMAFADMPTRFTRAMRYPASIALRYQDGVYGIDADKSFDVSDSILSILGKSLEKLLTSTPDEFEKYKKENSWKVNDIPEENYHYVEVEDFVLRSQLDCRDNRLPRKTFDLKTRGALAVRMDLENYKESKGYQILSMKGRLQSFEREYYDMARSAFLKYNFQVRIGNMDGIFVAYHNTARMFGFQYISRREMDEVLYGNELTGSKSFRMVLLLLGKLLRTATDQYPERDIRVTFDCPALQRGLEMWVEVINDEAEAIAVQQYQETGQYTTTKAAAATAAADPPGAEDPLTSRPAEPEDDGELDSELADAEVDPADEIYINDEFPITKYQVETFSTHKGEDTDEHVTVKGKDDKWFVNWCLCKSTNAPDGTAAQYRRLRLRQARYFERPSPDTPEEELSPLVRILRRISRRNMWRNTTPKGKVVVHHSRMPTHPSKKTRTVGKPKGPRPAGKKSGKDADKKVSKDAHKKAGEDASKDASKDEPSPPAPAAPDTAS